MKKKIESFKELGLEREPFTEIPNSITGEIERVPKYLFDYLNKGGTITLIKDGGDKYTVRYFAGILQ
jgi:hypothetical protein